MSTVTTTMSGFFVKGTNLIPSSTPVIVKMQNAPLPASITLKSSYASRLIQFSTDGGVEYFTPTYDVISATMLLVICKSGITHVAFTGQANDTWSIS